MYAEKTAGSKTESKVCDSPAELKRKKERSASTDNSTTKCKKLKSEKQKRKKRELSSESSSSSDSSQSSSSTSSSDERRKKRRKKKHKKEKKKLKKEKKKKKKRKTKKHKKQSKEEEIIGPVLPDTAAAKSSSLETVSQNPSKSMAPMTKEEWEKRQSVVRKVFDEETGRYRLIKGDGEVLEEIVSRERHREINKQATVGDGSFFQAKLATIHPK